jgi:enamine deaminase RidA (YjgF/YER057c/UK114 family)
MKGLITMLICGALGLITTSTHLLAQTTGAEARLKERNITLPPVPSPVANYVDSVRVGNLLFLAGKTAGADWKFKGKVGKDISAQEGYETARQVGLIMLVKVRGALGSLDRVKRIVKVLASRVATSFNRGWSRVFSRRKAVQHCLVSIVAGYVNVFSNIAFAQERMPPPERLYRSEYARMIAQERERLRACYMHCDALTRACLYSCAQGKWIDGARSECEERCASYQSSTLIYRTCFDQCFQIEPFDPKPNLSNPACESACETTRANCQQCNRRHW